MIMDTRPPVQMEPLELIQEAKRLIKANGVQISVRTSTLLRELEIRLKSK